ncbi:myeloid-associated differentiation marker homolog [Brachyhypopomus gauderio]|uniref:myeloid-associated differentiation marker homolog n=1 Tax=Brachyhypopomus gauderio TaxID=698409 RepID=UPI00404338C2
MPVTFGERSTLTTPLSMVRYLALFCSCLSFSLAKISSSNLLYSGTFYTFCMVTWCFFFTLTFLIIAINFTQFHSLLPLSWKNLTSTVASLGLLMYAAATFAFPCSLTAEELTTKPGGLTVTLGSFIATVAYTTELHLIRSQGGEQQRGYMATVPGLLKVVQVFGSCVALVLLSSQDKALGTWQGGVVATAYATCLLASLGTVLVMVGDCAGRCPLPFDRLLAGLTLLGLMAYMAATVVCFSRVLQERPMNRGGVLPLCAEAAVACLTLLAYTVDLAFSVKLLCDRN